MDLQVRSDHLRVTPELEEFVQKKLSKLDRYLPNIHSVQVELREEKPKRGPDIVVAQITLRHKRGAILRTEERLPKEDHTTIQTALLAAVDKMYRRIRRFKEKPRSKRTRERYSFTAEELVMAEPLPEEIESEVPDAEDTEVVSDEIVRRKKVSIAAMHEEEAIEQMELLGHSFFLFLNPDSNSMQVVYKRSNGGYGLLHPQID